jgi:hypothetical protein
MPSSELTECTRALSEVCDQTALRCSGSGARAGESLTGKLSGDFAHVAFADWEGGVMGT